MAQTIEIPQASIIPSMFIGLGGTGSRIVDRIATRAMGLPYWETHLRPLTHFVCVDTNQEDLMLLQKIPVNNRIAIGAFNKQHAVENYRESNNLQATQWLDNNYKPRSGEKPGAGQIRVESRLGFHFNSPIIREKLDSLLRRMLEADNSFRRKTPAQVNVYLFAGLGGGTGSGSFLPMTYLVQDVIRRLQWQPMVLGYFVLSTLMDKKVYPDLHTDIHANTYAALKELEHLTKLDYAETQVERPKGEPFVFWNDPKESQVPMVDHRPFYLSLILDRAKEELAAAEPLVGDAAFLEVFTPILGRVVGEVDNYEKHLTSLTRLPGRLKGVGRGYTKHFGAFGVAALVLPGSELLEYSALRFAAEALRQQITFGSSDSSKAIDAKLADLRVNYDDPLFARMSESERQAKINNAFILSMQAMASEDEKDGLTEGVWYKLVEDVDKGKITGRNEQGKEERAETLIARVMRLLDEERKPILAGISIPATNLLPVQPESLGNYNDILNKFEAAVASASVKIEEGKKLLRASAKQGDVVERLDPKPSPLQERYLVIRLLEQLDSKLIPEAASRKNSAVTRSFDNPKVRDKFRQENFSLLSDAANSKTWMVFKDRKAFEQVRDGVEQDFQQTSTAQRNYFEADLRLAQLQNLRDYLDSRARQYANLATRMNNVVGDLEKAAEAIRQGTVVDQPRFANSVEVFETMDKPTRLWREVFDELYVRGGRAQVTFDRQTLANAIADQLRPIRDKGTGKFVPKPEELITDDLKKALTDLGRERLRAAIFGGPGERGLTIESGIELEARICLRASAGTLIRDEEVDRYMERKLRAFSLLSGVYARLSQVDAETLDDGVKVARTRNLVIEESVLTSRFVQKIHTLLDRDGRPPQITGWLPVPNQHIAVTHDMDLPIPLYYFTSIVGDIEAHYERVAADPRRTYNLHIDYHWEETLPNLNPAKDKISTSWALDTLLDGLLYKVIQQNENRGYVWKSGDDFLLGPNLAAALYRLGEFYRSESEDDPKNAIRRTIDQNIRTAAQAISAEELLARTQKLLGYVNQQLLDVAMAGQRGEKTREDSLEQPIWRMFGERLEGRLAHAAEKQPQAAAARVARRLEL